MTHGTAARSTKNRIIPLWPRLFGPGFLRRTLGHLELVPNGQALAELMLVALTTVPEGSLAKRSADRLHLWFRGQGLVQAAP